MKEFTAENRASLERLYLELSFGNQTFSGKFGANQLSPFEALNHSTITSLQNLYKDAKTQVGILEDQSGRWNSDEAIAKRVKLLKTWQEFFDLCEGYRYDCEAKQDAALAIAKKKAELQRDIAKEERKNVTLEDLKKQLAALEG